MKKLMLFMMAALCLTCCKEDDFVTTDETTTTPQITGLWQDDIAQLYDRDSITVFLNILEDGSGTITKYNLINMTSEVTPITTVYHINDSYSTYTMPNGEGGMFDVHDEYGCLLFADERDSVAVFTRSQYECVEAFIQDYENFRNDKSEYSDVAGQDEADLSILVTPADQVVQDTETRGVISSIAQAVLGKAAEALFSYARNAIVADMFSEDESAFTWFTESKKLNLIYETVKQIELKDDKFHEAEAKYHGATTYAQMFKDFTSWYNVIVPGLESVSEIEDEATILQKVKDWGYMNDKASNFVTYLETIISSSSFPYMIYNDNGTTETNMCDIFDFVHQWGYSNYCWNVQTFDFYKAFMSGEKEMIGSGTVLAAAYFTYVDKSQTMIDKLAKAYDTFSKRYDEMMTKLTPSEYMVECQIPNCHIKLARKMKLCDYGNIQNVRSSIQASDIECEFFSSAIALLAADYVNRTSDYAVSLTFNPDLGSKDATLLQYFQYIPEDKVQLIFDAYKNTPEAGNLGKILTTYAGMTFDNPKGIADADINTLFFEKKSKDKVWTLPLIYLPNYNDISDVEYIIPNMKSQEGKPTLFLYGSNNGTGKQGWHAATELTYSTEKKSIFHKRTYDVNGVSQPRDRYWLIPYLYVNKGLFPWGLN